MAPSLNEGSADLKSRSLRRIDGAKFQRDEIIAGFLQPNILIENYNDVELEPLFLWLFKPETLILKNKHQLGDIHIQELRAPILPQLADDR